MFRLVLVSTPLQFLSRSIIVLAAGGPRRAVLLWLDDSRHAGRRPATTTNHCLFNEAAEKVMIWWYEYGTTSPKLVWMTDWSLTTGSSAFQRPRSDDQFDRFRAIARNQKFCPDEQKMCLSGQLLSPPGIRHLETLMVFIIACPYMTVSYVTYLIRYVT